ncbi:Rap/Ran GTPase activating protein [Entamoeba marina]
MTLSSPIHDNVNVFVNVYTANNIPFNKTTSPKGISEFLFNSPLSLGASSLRSAIHFSLVEDNVVIASCLLPLTSCNINTKTVLALPLVSPVLLPAGHLVVIVFLTPNSKEIPADVLFRFRRIEINVTRNGDNQKKFIVSGKVGSNKLRAMMNKDENDVVIYMETYGCNDFTVKCKEIKSNIKSKLLINTSDCNAKKYRFDSQNTSFNSLDLFVTFVPSHLIPLEELLPPITELYMVDDWSSQENEQLLCYSTEECIISNGNERKGVTSKHYIDKPIKNIISNDDKKKCYCYGEDTIVCCGEQTSDGSCKVVLHSPKQSKRFLSYNRRLEDDLSSLLPSQQKLRHLSSNAWKDIINYEERISLKGFKFGLVIGCKGQTTEQEFLSNSSASNVSTEFMKLLGNVVELENFDKYSAGLDVSTNTTGTHSLYTEYENTQIMFHVSTMLNHVNDDEQYLDKKRHIGNDVCVIIFKEGNEDIDLASFVSQLNHIFIIIRPVVHESIPCYDVVVATNKLVKPFAPLFPSEQYFKRDAYFRDWLLQKLMNGEQSALLTPKFISSHSFATSIMLKDIVKNHAKKR